MADQPLQQEILAPTKEQIDAARDYDRTHRPVDGGGWTRVPDDQVRRLLAGLAQQGLVLVRADDPRAVTQEILGLLNARLSAAEASVTRVDARHQPHVVPQIRPCAVHARPVSGVEHCPDCHRGTAVMCSHITCCYWPCQAHLDLYGETEQTCTHTTDHDGGDHG